MPLDLEEQEQVAELKAWWRQHGNLIVSVILMGMSRQPHATEVTPSALLLAAAATPATAVPCPCTSLVSELLSYIFHPGTICEARSG